MPQLQKYMRRCLELAVLAAGNVSPNPMVGAVVVFDDKIAGEGSHERFGEAHAEVNAIKQVLGTFPDAEELLKKSTIYVSLEPCTHFGKTPPCADLIIRYQIPKVVIGCRDPFDSVNGNGIEKLKDAGIEVIEGVLEQECRYLNRRFFTRVQKQRPYIVLKWAQTANGFFSSADNTQKWITSPLSKLLVHRWRSEEDAVLVGKNTARIDNPQLNVRETEGKNPLRIVIDRNLSLPLNLNLFDQSIETIVFNSIKTEVAGRVKYIQTEDFDRYLPQLICYQLYLMDIQSLIIEGGAKTLDLFIKAGLWDEARIFTAPQYWTEGIAAPVISGELAEEIVVGPDKLTVLLNNQN